MKEGSSDMADVVRAIVDAVAKEGIEAALAFTRDFDGVEMSPQEVLWNPLEWEGEQPETRVREAIDYAMDRIRAFHRAARPEPLVLPSEGGLTLEEQFVPLQRVGLYVPNGNYPLISSLLMTAIPAQEAGVKEIVVAVSPRDDIRQSPVWLYAFQSLGISTVLRLGGAQAVAAMGYGFPGFAPVDFIAGPGNRYVTQAKQELARRGVVGIDLPAGPSEVLIIANQLDLEPFVWADLLAQAEHDRDASAELITLNPALAERIEKRRALVPEGMGQIVVTRVHSMREAVTLANRRAPEHLGLMGDDVEGWAEEVRTAGALFIGPMAGQALGDYVAGPSHVLPTGGSGRFQSGLSTRTFLRRMSVIRTTQSVDPQIFEMGARLAELEGLTYHQRSLEVRRAALEVK